MHPLPSTITHFVGPIDQYYCYDNLGLSVYDYAVLSAVLNIPDAIKIMFALTVSHAPVMSRHHKPYLLLGWLCCSVGFGLMASSSDLGYDKAGRHTTTAPASTATTNITTINDQDHPPRTA